MIRFEFNSPRSSLQFGIHPYYSPEPPLQSKISMSIKISTSVQTLHFSPDIHFTQFSFLTSAQNPQFGPESPLQPRIPTSVYNPHFSPKSLCQSKSPLRSGIPTSVQNFHLCPQSQLQSRIPTSVQNPQFSTHPNPYFSLESPLQSKISVSIKISTSVQNFRVNQNPHFSPESPLQSGILTSVQNPNSSPESPTSVQQSEDPFPLELESEIVLNVDNRFDKLRGKTRQVRVSTVENEYSGILSNFESTMFCCESAKPINTPRLGKNCAKLVLS